MKLKLIIVFCLFGVGIAAAVHCLAPPQIESLSNLIQAAAVAAGVLVAYLGLDQWKHQFTWTKNSELANEVMQATQDYKDAVERIRRNLGHADEGATRPKATDETSEETRKRNRLYIHIERIQREELPIKAFFQTASKAQFRFGPEVIKQLDAIKQIHRDILFAATMTAEQQYDLDRNVDTSDPSLQAERKEWMRTLWKGGSKDEIGRRLEEAYSGLTEALRTYLRES